MDGRILRRALIADGQVQCDERHGPPARYSRHLGHEQKMGKIADTDWKSGQY